MCGMKLIVVIPALNEEKTIGNVIEGIPRDILGIDIIEVIVVDDGSVDMTRDVAQRAGATYIISHKKQEGLAQTFQEGITNAVRHGADIIVTIDGDGQYNSQEISKLVAQILEGKADMIIGDRQIKTLTHMSRKKKWGNRWGSAFLRLLLGTTIQDASSGFRVFSRSCAEGIHITSFYTYTHENIIQSVFQGKIIKEVPITFNKRSFGSSRLFKNLIIHIAKAGLTIISSYFAHLIKNPFWFIQKTNRWFFSFFLPALLFRFFIEYFSILQGKFEYNAQFVSPLIAGVSIPVVLGEVLVIFSAINISNGIFKRIHISRILLSVSDGIIVTAANIIISASVVPRGWWTFSDTYSSPFSKIFLGVPLWEFVGGYLAIFLFSLGFRFWYPYKRFRHISLLALYLLVIILVRFLLYQST